MNIADKIAMKESSSDFSTCIKRRNNGKEHIRITPSDIANIRRRASNIFLNTCFGK